MLRQNGGALPVSFPLTMHGGSGKHMHSMHAVGKWLMFGPSPSAQTQAPPVIVPVAMQRKVLPPVPLPMLASVVDAAPTVLAMPAVPAVPASTTTSTSTPTACAVAFLNACRETFDPHGADFAYFLRLLCGEKWRSNHRSNGSKSKRARSSMGGSDDDKDASDDRAPFTVQQIEAIKNVTKAQIKFVMRVLAQSLLPKQRDREQYMVTVLGLSGDSSTLMTQSKWTKNDLRRILRALADRVQSWSCIPRVLHDKDDLHKHQTQHKKQKTHLKKLKLASKFVCVLPGASMAYDHGCGC